MAKAPIPYPRQLQRNGLVFLAVGLVGALLLALLHGGITWSNIGLLFLVFGAVMIIIGRVLESRTRDRVGARDQDH